MVGPNDPSLPAAHSLLRGTFAKHELVSLRDWRDTLTERQAQIWTDSAWHLFVAERQGKVLGAATGTYLGNVNVGVIGYLTVDPSARRLGLGPRLRRRLKLAFQRDARNIQGGELAGVVGEVRRDNPWLKVLIRRADVIALDFPYFQPGLRPGERAVPLVLYYEGVGVQRKTLGGAELRRLLYTIWRRVYRMARPLTSKAFRRMIGELAKRRIVGELPLVRPKRAARR